MDQPSDLRMDAREVPEERAIGELIADMRRSGYDLRISRRVVSTAR